MNRPVKEKHNCEFCEKPMTEKDHDFCDICGDCRDEHDFQ